jgi:ferric-dicitrate binding protein FerR (iron transport regulator)
MTHINQPDNTEFIHDPKFVEWVLLPTAQSNQFWEAFLHEHPSRKKELEQARFLVKGLNSQQKSLTDAEVSVLWDQIRQTDLIRKRRTFSMKRWSVAAGILMILGFSGWWLSTSNNSKTKEINYQSIAVLVNPGNEIKLILSNKTQKTFSAKEVELKYNQQGKLETKTGNKVETEDLNQGSETVQMNQLVVPRGKRSTVVLADGTKLWLNSGSRAIYPVTFNGKTREIFIEGEGYLEVAHNESKPFYVVTDQIKVKVLGTKFDISAYRDDTHVSVVLVEGSVQASTATENLVMKPNQILNYEKLTQRLTIEKTNVLEYVSWKDGWMLCNKEPIQSITTKLSRYYDIKINYSDLSLSNMTITGKLDLKSNCEDVLKVICATAPLKYEINNNNISLTIK